MSKFTVLAFCADRGVDGAAKTGKELESKKGYVTHVVNDLMRDPAVVL
jgi:hypothetical protein